MIRFPLERAIICVRVLHLHAICICILYVYIYLYILDERCSTTYGHKEWNRCSTTAERRETEMPWCRAHRTIESNGPVSTRAANNRRWLEGWGVGKVERSWTVPKSERAKNERRAEGAEGGRVWKTRGKERAGRGQRVKYDSRIREIWDRNEGILCPRPLYGHKGLSCPWIGHWPSELPFWYSTSVVSSSSLSSVSGCTVLSSPFLFLKPSLFFVPLFLEACCVGPFAALSFLVGSCCPVKGSAK